MRRTGKQITGIFLLVATLLSCIQGGDRAVIETGFMEPKSAESETEQVVSPVEKENPTEAVPTDNDLLYQNTDDSSVIKLYLTVNSGNEADGSNHTWAEVNSYSAEYYSNLGIDRYKVEGILQIDEGNGIDASSFGFEEKVPNVSVQVRGQTSSRSDIKNYKIRIKDGKREFRGQRTLNLNKHLSDPYRFTNKICYDLLNRIPQLIGGRTQFAQLYVCDNTEGGSGEYQDYGLYTIVEQVNRTYLKNRHLDENGQLYKVTFFEWNEYEAVSTPIDSVDFDMTAFEQYMEIKGDRDTAKLNQIVEKLNNRMIPIDDIIEQHFDAENICYWMAFNILVGNYDSGARNLFLYSPLNSEKFYFICWDLDASMRRNYMGAKQYSEGLSWERGMSQYLGLVLTNRMLKEEKYRNMLQQAVDDLHDNYVNKDAVDVLVKKYSEITIPFLYGGADTENAKLLREDFDTLSASLGDEVEYNYAYFCATKDYPWPFYVGLPEMDGEKMVISWDASYDINGEAVTYDYIIAKDYHFEDVVMEGYMQIAPSITIEPLSPGKYFLRVRATNESGYTQDCFDYYSARHGGKVYGCLAFEIKGDGTATYYTTRE